MITPPIVITSPTMITPPTVMTPPTCCLQNQALDDQAEAQKHDDAQAGEMEGEEEEEVSQQTVVSGVRQGGRRQLRRGGRGWSLRYLTVNPGPSQVALARELVFHVQDVVVVEVTADMETGASRGRVSVDVEEAWVQMQVGTRVQSLSDTPAVLLAQSFAAQLGGCGDVDDVMTHRTVDVFLHCLTVFLHEQRDKNTVRNF